MQNKNFKLFVGVDISKNSFSACALTSPEEILFQASFPMSYEGFNAFSEKLSSFPKNSILIAQESTGCYYINLFSFLTQNHFHCLIINPLIVNKFRTATLRKTKTDKIDAKAIAVMLFHIHKRLPENSYLLQELRAIAREREKTAQQIARLKNDMEKLLVFLFPELERYVNIYNSSILRLLSSFPSAHSIKSAPIDKLKKILKEKPGRPTSATAEKIKKLAKSSIAQNWPMREIILLQKIKELIFLKKKLAFFTNILRKYCQKASLSHDLSILKSIKGIGDITAIAFLTEIIDMKRFPSPKKLIAYSGLDPSVYESGGFKGKSKISKRGNKHIRRIAWLMAVGVVRHNGYFKGYFQKRRAAGLPFKKAILAVAHKLLRVTWSMLTKKQPFSFVHALSLYHKEVSFS